MPKLLLALLAFALAGCATIITGTTKPVNITSTPSGAVVSIQGKQVRTPGTILLSRSWSGDGSGYIKYEEEADAIATVSIPAEFEPWFLGNIIFGGLIGMFTDLATGACRDYPDVVHFDLVDGAWHVGLPESVKRPVGPIASSDVIRLGATPTDVEALSAKVLADIAHGEIALRNVTKPVPGWVERDGSLHDEGWTWTAETRVYGRFTWAPIRYLWSTKNDRGYWVRVNPTTPEKQSIGEYQVVRPSSPQ